jgi:hypothetical protein
MTGGSNHETAVTAARQPLLFDFVNKPVNFCQKDPLDVAGCWEYFSCLASTSFLVRFNQVCPGPPDLALMGPWSKGRWVPEDPSGLGEAGLPDVSLPPGEFLGTDMGASVPQPLMAGA